jgi:hypothetical protein
MELLSNIIILEAKGIIIKKPPKLNPCVGESIYLLTNDIYKIEAYRKHHVSIYFIHIMYIYKK